MQKWLRASLYDKIFLWLFGILFVPIAFAWTLDHDQNYHTDSVWTYFWNLVNFFAPFYLFGKVFDLLMRVD